MSRVARRWETILQEWLRCCRRSHSRGRDERSKVTSSRRHSEAAHAEATRRVQRRWDRVAPLFDRLEAGLERRALQWWRRRLWSQVETGRILEVGGGTGKNIPYYPPGAEVVAIDLSPRMIEEARKVAAEHGSDVDLRVMDAQRLDFPDAYFDAVVTSCVFCTVPNPALGLSEVYRVLKPGHRAYFLEHVLSDKRGVRRAMKGLSRVTVRMMGDHLTRRTCAELSAAGFELETEEDLWLDVIKLCVARKPAAG